MNLIFDGSLDKLAFRAVFGENMEALAAADSNVVYLDADMMSSIDTRNFWKRNPQQAINCGIAEANMMGVAAGLSAGGKKPYVHTFGPFASRRVYDQVVLSIAYAGLSVRIFGTDPGVAAAFNGGTHMPFEDLALYRAIPRATVIEISDSTMLKNIMWQIKEREGLTYVRMTRKNYHGIYGEGNDFKIGKGLVLREGGDAAVIACGMMVSEAMLAAEILAGEGIHIKVIDMFTIKPLDVDLVREAAKTGLIVTAENHNIVGGLGEAVATALIEANAAPGFRRIGMRESFGEVGPVDYLQEKFGLNAENIAKTIREAL
ncbi:MAG: transketolase family protein [Clostridiales bacterium]|jgi:transketolase|nr:transketolase family protein [Clostridiales bacterium]